MIGVILWSDSKEQQAVIWCEDQGDLAFLSSPDSTYLPDAFFEVGDMVEFDVSTQRNLRLAHNTNRLNPSFGASLTKVLKATASVADDGANDQAKIVPFRVAAANRHDPDTPPFRRRQG